MPQPRQPRHTQTSALCPSTRPAAAGPSAPPPPSLSPHLVPPGEGTLRSRCWAGGGEVSAHDTVVRFLPFGVPSLSPHFPLSDHSGNGVKWTDGWWKEPPCSRVTGSQDSPTSPRPTPHGSGGPWGRGPGKAPEASWVAGACGAWGTLPRWVPRQGAWVLRPRADGGVF